MKKRLFSTALAMLLLFNICDSTVTAVAIENIGINAQYIASFIESNGSDYSSQLSKLLNEYEVEDGFGKIVLDAENNTIQRDDEEAVALDEESIDLSALNSGETIIPAVSVLQAAGYNAHYDEENAEVIVENDNHSQSYNFIDDSVGSDDEIIKQDNGYVSAKINEKTVELPAAYMNEKQAEDYFNFETKRIGSKIVVTNPYQSKRLIVTTKESKKLKTFYSAEKCVYNGKNEYVLQYKTEKAAKVAYKLLKSNTNVKSVVCDEVVFSNALSVRNGAQTINSDRYKTYLQNNGKNSKIVVAVVDTGVDMTHEFLKGRLVKGYNAFTKKTDVKDGNGHGTHVAGIVADNTPSNVKIMPIKVMKDNGTGTSLSIKLGIEYAIKKKANVINISLGGFCTEKDCPIALAVKAAVKAGITVAVAAGNSTMDTKYQCPCNLTEPIVVASTRHNGAAVSTFSNFGSTVDLSAPGENILSSYKNNKYKELSGTSMAAPFVAAAAAMVLTENPSLKPSQVESKLKSYCADMYFKGFDKYSGSGVINLGIPLGDNFKADRINTSIEKTN